MKKVLRISILLIIILISVNTLVIASYESGGSSSSTISYIPAGGGENGANVALQYVNGDRYLFLPSSADLSNLALSLPADSAKLTANGTAIDIQSGVSFDLLSLFDNEPENGKYNVVFSFQGYYYRVNIMHSSGLDSLYITSSDPSKAQSYVDSKKGLKAKDNGMLMVSAEDEVIYSGVMKEIKGRGNSTWFYPKKPYQFKLNESFDLLAAGENEKSKTWILLANYYDNSLIRNILTQDLAKLLNLNYAHNCKAVDLYYDGVYCGNYLLIEKTEIDSARVAIRNLEKEIEKLNGDDVDFDELDKLQYTNDSGISMQYVQGVKLPEDYSGGYLLEMDYTDRALEEVSWFRSRSGQYIVSKSPEYLPREALEYAGNIYQLFEDAVFNGGINPNTGKDYTEYVDLESLASNYLLLTLSQNGDAFLSSTYFYIPENEAKLYAGPVWDYDTAYGLYEDDGDSSKYQYYCSQLADKLFRIESFRQAVKEQWELYLKSAVDDVLLNESDSCSVDGLKSLAAYKALYADSRRMDAVRWGHKADYDTEIASLYEYIANSSKWVDGTLLNPKIWAAIPYTDVPLNSWYAESVSYTSEKGIFNGTSSSSFSPNNHMSRYMMVSILYRMAGSPEIEGECSYVDVPADAHYRNAVIWAEGEGITEGYGNGMFAPFDTLTREQMAVFLHRFAVLQGANEEQLIIPEEYADVNTVSSWAYEGVAWAINNGIINGVNSEVPTIDPKGTITRAMAATMAHRYMTDN
ncbi:MAG: CotH kinase family protein [Oscillospiraceae bacterium]|nr:CotH kinase family protein [Oscillospiraceae bacterium]